MITRIAAVVLPGVVLLSALQATEPKPNEPVAEVRFVDSATGCAIVPDRLEARGHATGVSQRWARDRFSGRVAKLNLVAGRQTLTVSSAGYRPVSGEFDMAPGNPYRIVFQLDPIEPPREIQPHYLAGLHRVKETLFVGYVTAEDTGEPLAGARVRAEPSGREATSDARGYFQVHVPVQTRDEALSSPARLRFSHPGYGAVEHQYLELWSEGDWVYRIQLERGAAEQVVDERQLRRRPGYPIQTREEGVTSGVDASAVPAALERRSLIWLCKCQRTKVVGRRCLIEG